MAQLFNGSGDYLQILKAPATSVFIVSAWIKMKSKTLLIKRNLVVTRHGDSKNDISATDELFKEA